MSKWRIGIFAVAVSLLCVSMPLFAHHGTAVFDVNNVLTLKGSVTEWDWSNPHCLLQFDVGIPGALGAEIADGREASVESRPQMVRGARHAQRKPFARYLIGPRGFAVGVQQDV